MLEADYLVVGSGAMGMAFVDILVTESNASVIMVDRYHKPGGHWNKAYPFVTLHQPSQFYGVSSRELSNGNKDTIGWNKGLYELATGDEILAYYDAVMREQFIPSGQVQYFPMCEYLGNGQFQSKLTGEIQQVKVNKKIVNCTFLNTEVPSTHTPNFTINENVNFIAINDLPNIQESPDQYVIIGGGKTGIDACLWLLSNKVPSDRITWVVSRDAWLLDRQKTQPTEEFFEDTIGNQANQFECVAQSSSIDDLFERLESKGVLVRIDKSIQPKMFHGATISMEELKHMRSIHHVIRRGRIKSLNPSEITFLDGSTISTSANAVYIDCSATPIKASHQDIPVFTEGIITPQTVRSYQPVFSAAFIAHIELTRESDQEKNNLCSVVPLPNHDTDWIRMLGTLMMNQFNWSQHKDLRQWLRGNRLDGFSQMVKNVAPDDLKKNEILKRMRDNAMPAMLKIQSYMSEISEKNDI